MFDIDVAGFSELEGGKPPHRLAFEPVVNVFDEYRGYDEARRKPSYCAVTMELNPTTGRGVVLTVADDGAGFAHERDIWTLFGTSAKRGKAGVSGRFNAGDKQLIALAREATIKTNSVTVTFKDGKRDVTRHRQPIVSGTIVECLMPWSRSDMDSVIESLRSVTPPDGLSFTVNGQSVAIPEKRCMVTVTLPTVSLIDGVMKPTTRKCVVVVRPSDSPMLCELGIPVCGLEDVGFPWSLDVQQKIPLPMSRDTVSPAYLYRLIGSVIEQAAMDGVQLLTEDQEGAGFLKAALDWIRDANALKATTASVYGENAVRVSSDPIANAQAAASGASLIPGNCFTPETRKRMADWNTLPTAKEVYGGTERLMELNAKPAGSEPCDKCGGIGWTMKDR